MSPAWAGRFFTAEPPGKTEVTLCKHAKSLQIRSDQSLSRVRLFVTPWTVAHQAPLSMGFSRQEYWSGLSCPPPGDLPDPRTEPESLMSPALAGRLFTTSATWEAPKLPYCCCKRTTQQIFIEFLKYVSIVLGGRTKQ